MVDYHPTFKFYEALASDVAANYRSSDTTIVYVAADANQPMIIRASDHHYIINNHALNSFNGICSSSQNPPNVSGYIQRYLMTWSGATAVSYCYSSDAAVIQFLWNAPGPL
jgi:hypothetical protein